MLKVFKYNVPTEDMSKIEMPKFAKILSFQMQDGRPVIWALVDDEAETEKRTFRFCGTGDPVNIRTECLIHIGTIQQLGGRLVWHLFEVVKIGI